MFGQCWSSSIVKQFLFRGYPSDLFVVVFVLQTSLMLLKEFLRFINNKAMHTQEPALPRFLCDYGPRYCSHDVYGVGFQTLTFYIINVIRTE